MDARFYCEGLYKNKIHVTYTRTTTLIITKGSLEQTSLKQNANTEP